MSNTMESATDALSSAVHEAMASLPNAVQAIKDARAASSWDNDILGEMRATIVLIVALEAAADVIAGVHKSVRAALAESMRDCGAPAIAWTSARMERRKRRRRHVGRSQLHINAA